MKKIGAIRILFKAAGAIGFIAIILQLAACDFVTHSEVTGTVEFTGTRLTPKFQQSNLFYNQEIVVDGGWGFDGLGGEVMSKYKFSLDTPLFSLQSKVPGANEECRDAENNYLDEGMYSHNACYDEIWQYKEDTVPGVFWDKTRSIMHTQCYLNFDANQLFATHGNIQGGLFDCTVIVVTDQRFKLQPDGNYLLTPYHEFFIHVKLENSAANSIRIEFAGFEGENLIAMYR